MKTLDINQTNRISGGINAPSTNSGEPTLLETVCDLIVASYQLQQTYKNMVSDRSLTDKFINQIAIDYVPTLHYFFGS